MSDVLLYTILRGADRRQGEPALPGLSLECLGGKFGDVSRAARRVEFEVKLPE
jgi:hypothetical protein